MQFEFEGKQYQFHYYGVPSCGDVFIDFKGVVLKKRNTYNPGTRLILKPLEIHHTFGGVVWKEGGAKRKLQAGEMGWHEPSDELLGFQRHGTLGEYIPLIPIALA